MLKWRCLYDFVCGLFVITTLPTTQMYIERTLIHTHTLLKMAYLNVRYFFFCSRLSPYCDMYPICYGIVSLDGECFWRRDLNGAMLTDCVECTQPNICLVVSLITSSHFKFNRQSTSTTCIRKVWRRKLRVFQRIIHKSITDERISKLFGRMLSVKDEKPPWFNEI